MVLPVSIHSPSGERIPISFWEISALYMYMIMEGPFTGCSALPSQLTSDYGTRANPVGLSPWDLQEQKNVGLFQPVAVSNGSRHQELGAPLTSSATLCLQCFLTFSQLPRSLWFKLMESVSLLVREECCLLTMYYLCNLTKLFVKLKPLELD